MKYLNMNYLTSTFIDPCSGSCQQLEYLSSSLASLIAIARKSNTSYIQMNILVKEICIHSDQAFLKAIYIPPAAGCTIIINNHKSINKCNGWQ